MIDKEFAKKQAARMAGLEQFPHEPEAINEIILALQCAQSEQIAQEFTDGIVQNECQCPKPAEIRKALFSKQDDGWKQAEEYQNTGPLCRRCQGWGSAQDAATGVWDRCNCYNGKVYPQNLLDIQNNRLNNIAARGDSRRLALFDREDIERTLARAIVSRRASQ